MAALTDKDLEEKRAKNERLREQIAAAQAKSAAAAGDQNRVIEAATLDAETARLEQQLAAAKETAKVSVVREGAAGPLTAVTEQLEAAQAGVTVPGTTVDTNAENPPSDTGQTVAVDESSADTKKES